MDWLSDTETTGVFQLGIVLLDLLLSLVFDKLGHVDEASLRCATPASSVLGCWCLELAG